MRSGHSLQSHLARLLLNGNHEINQNWRRYPVPPTNYYRYALQKLYQRALLDHRCIPYVVVPDSYQVRRHFPSDLANKKGA